MGQERPNLISMFSRCFKKVIVPGWGAMATKPIEIANGMVTPQAAEFKHNQKQKQKPVFPKRRSGEQC